MNILHISTSDRKGGAAIAAHRIHAGLCQLGMHSSMGVQYKDGDDPACFYLADRYSFVAHPLLRGLDRASLRRYRRPDQPSLFSPMLLPSILYRQVARRRPDIVHLHWIQFSFFPLFALERLTSPVVWTTHDCWPFTGGCHITGDCDRFEDHCGQCPSLGSARARDLSRRIWERKRSVYARLKPVFVAPSRLFADKARRSSLLSEARVEYIPNPVDTDMFRPIPQAVARQALGLPLPGRLLVFGAMEATSDPCKGYDLLREALGRLPRAAHQDVSCLVFGDSPARQAPELPFPVRFLGRLRDENSLALAYAAADVFVCPSREESFSNTTLEALACGTPVAGFSVGGVPDMVEHQVNGYLAQPRDTGDLAMGIAWILEDDERRRRLGEAARSTVMDRFCQHQVAGRYLELYMDVTGQPPVESVWAGFGRPAAAPTVFDIRRMGRERLDPPLSVQVKNLAEVRRLREVAHSCSDVLEQYIRDNKIDCPEKRRGDAIAALDIEGGWSGTAAPEGESSPRPASAVAIRSAADSPLSPGKRRLKRALLRLGLLEMAKQCKSWYCHRLGRGAGLADPAAAASPRRTTGLYCGNGELLAAELLGNHFEICTPGCRRETRAALNAQPRSRWALASWLADDGMADLASDAVFVFGPNSDLRGNVNMLRGMLEPGHRLAVPADCDIPGLGDWKSEERLSNGLTLRTGPPADWLRTRTWIREGRMWPRFTVVTPSFNQQPFARQALESIFSQNYPNLETIVLDAGSTDGTRDILREFAPRITHLILEPDEGQSDALQKGFSLATGTYLTWLNTDDLLEQDALFLGVEAFERHGVDMVVGGCRIVDEAGNELDRHYPAMPFNLPIKLEVDKMLDILGSWMPGDFFYQPEVFFTRDLWQRSGAFFHKHAYYGMDYDLWVRMGLAGGVAVQLPRMLAANRHQRNQKTNLDGSEAPYLWQALNFGRHYEKIFGAILSSQEAVTAAVAGAMKR